MKANILLLLLLSSLLLGCRSKQKITTTYKEDRKETEKVKTDSLSVHHSTSIQNEYADAVVQEKKNEISGDLLITGKSDTSNPFVYHNVIGSDTVQSISIMGNAEYMISTHYTKADRKKSEVKKSVFTNSIQDSAQKVISKEAVKEVASKVSEETKKVTVNGFEIAAWIFITILGITLILLFFTYKYFKK